MLTFVLTFFSSILALIFVQWLVFLYSRPKGLPPGPFPLPFIGNLWIFFLYRDYCALFNHLHEKYGEAVSIYAGCSMSGMLVLVFGWDSIVEISSDRKIAEVASDRQQFLAMVRGVKVGIGAADYELARERRAFLQRSFKELGLSATVTPPFIENELSRLISEVQLNIGKPLKMNHLITETIASCILLTINGHRFDMNDKACLELYEGGRRFFDGNFLHLALAPHIQWLKMLVGDDMAVAEQKIESIMSEWLSKEMSQRLSSKNRARDLLDIYMSVNRSEKLDDGFLRTMVDVFLGSMDPTTTAIEWALFYLATMQDEQERIAKEIVEVVPDSSFPTIQHRSKLVRLEAFLQESARFSCSTTNSFPRRCSANISFGPDKQYELQKGSSFVCIWFPSHFDRKYWRDPENFRVNRWLDSNDDKELLELSHCIPFGIGTRSCPGEQIGRNLVFLAVASLLQRFKWKLNEQVPFNAFTYKLTRIPVNHKLVFETR